LRLQIALTDKDSMDGSVPVSIGDKIHITQLYIKVLAANENVLFNMLGFIAFISGFSFPLTKTGQFLKIIDYIGN